MATVIKIGGSCLRDSGAYNNIINYVKSSIFRNEKIILVVSAFYGVTDTLITLLEAAASGCSYKSELRKIKHLHNRIIDLVVGSEIERKYARSIIHEKLTELESLLYAISVIGEKSDKTIARIISYGELLSSPVISAMFRSEGIKAKDIPEQRHPIITDKNYLNAKIDYPLSNDILEKNIIPLLENYNPVIIPGFIGRTGIDTNAEITTLGRGGSDTTAASIAYLLTAESLIFFKDVNGIMTCDPKIVDDAITVEKISYQEVYEAGLLGAKILNYDAVKPAIKSGIKIIIKNIFAPETSTVVTDDETPGIKAMVVNRNLNISSENTKSDILFSYSIKERLSAVYRDHDDGKLTSISFVGYKIPAGDIARILYIFNENNAIINNILYGDYSLSIVFRHKDPDNLINKLHAYIFQGR